MSEEGWQTGFNQLFPKFANIPINKRIEFTVMRFKENYFLNKSSSDVAAFPDEIQPLRHVNEEVYKKCISRDMIAKEKKLAWVYDNMDEEFAELFKESYVNNEFKSVSNAIKMACELYAKNNSDYSASQAVVSVINGQKTVKRKREHDSDSDDFRKRVTSILENNKTKFANMLKLDKNNFTKEIENRNNSKHMGFRLIGNATTEKQRIMSLTISLLHEILTKTNE